MIFSEKELHSLYKTAPEGVGVYEVSAHDLTHLYNSPAKRPGGMYLEVDGKRSILVCKEYEPHIRAFVFFHELGHYHCSMKNCFCCDRPRSPISESHATLFAIQELNKLGLNESLYYGLGFIASRMYRSIKDKDANEGPITCKTKKWASIYRKNYRGLNAKFKNKTFWISVRPVLNRRAKGMKYATRLI